MIMTENRPTFYAILKAKNEAYEFIMKYMKLDKNLTVGSYYLDCRSLFPHFRWFGYLYHQAAHFRSNHKAWIQRNAAKPNHLHDVRCDALCTT